MIAQSFIPEIQHEAGNTQRMLERIPQEYLAWQPHEKSKPLGPLATHIANLLTWILYILKTDELDLSKANFKTPHFDSISEIIQFQQKNLEAAIAALGNATDEQMTAKWRLRNGEQILFELPRMAAIRAMTMNHIIHHRAQISVYLRLLNVPVPGMYGPSADES